MKRKWKILITALVVLIAVVGVYASTVYSKRGVVTVQTGRVVKTDLTSLVTASGEINSPIRSPAHGWRASWACSTAAA